MATTEKYFCGILDKVHKAAKCALEKNSLDEALEAIYMAARLQYSANLWYTNETTESILVQIAQKLPEPAYNPKNQNRILFYDGFGLNSRGLSRIYLKALGKCGQLVYVTHARERENIPDLLGLLESLGAEVVWLKEKTFANIARELCSVFAQCAPDHAFLYTTPSDVAAVTAFQRNAGYTHRYLINLTDHAYWLGTSAFDTCIEFRDYGASISRDKRNIPAQKLVKVPFYPAIDFDAPFQGFPFPVPEGAKVVFSGGALYKTMGGEDRYYAMVDFILKEFPQAIFWYAGFGDTSKLDILIRKYPGRVYFTRERSDLFQVLQNCFLYLSTYPICGGLMFQYAASAGKIPVTLRYDDISDDFLLDQDHLGIQFETEAQVHHELRRLFLEDDYRTQKEARIKSAVLNQEAFEKSIEGLLQTENSGYEISFKMVDIERFHQENIKKLEKNKIAEHLVGKKSLGLLRYVPMVFLRGMAYKIKRKLAEKWK